MPLIVDSGAYSAWRLGKPIEVDTYCNFLLDNLDWITLYVALDVINPEDPEVAAAASWENFLRMRKRGLNPMPVWHVKEDLSWLFRMLDAGCDYIGISASSLVSRNHVDKWYAVAFDNLVTSSGLPIVKTHAFGEGRYSSLIKFPFYSSDTTSWIYSAQRNANIRLDDSRHVNTRRDLASTSASRNINDLSELDNATFDRLLAKAGIARASLDDADPKTSYTMNTFLTMLYYLDVQDRIRRQCPIHFRRPGFLSPMSTTMPAINIDRFNLHFVLGGNISATAVALWLKAENTLISYFQMQSTTKESSMLGMIRDVVKDPEMAIAKWPRLGRYYTLLSNHVTREPYSNAKQRTSRQTAPLQESL